MISLDKLTTKTQTVLQTAHQQAYQKHHAQCLNLHLLAALIDTPETAVQPLLKKQSISISTALNQIQHHLDKLPHIQHPNQPALSDEVGLTFKKAQKEADLMEDAFISCEHLFIALSKDKGIIGKLFKDWSLQTDTLYTDLKSIRGHARVDSPDPEGQYDVLNKYTIDLIQQAQKGKLDPVIGQIGRAHV